MTKKVLLTMTAIGVLGGGALMASSAFAQTTPADRPMSSLAQEIADKFHLNKDEVQAVFDKHHQGMVIKKSADYEAQLKQLVADGKITEQQRQLLLDKHNQLIEEMKSHKDELKNMTPDERRAHIVEKKKELEEWAKQNGVDVNYLWVGKFGMKAHSFGQHDQKFFFHEAPSPTQ